MEIKLNHNPLLYNSTQKLSVTRLAGQQQYSPAASGIHMKCYDKTLRQT